MSTEPFIRTGRPEFDALIPWVRSFLERSAVDMVIDGDAVRGWRSPDAPSVWIRDLSDMLRALRWFEPDLTSAVDQFARNQADSGRIFDYFTTFPEKLPCERENWTKFVRVPVEADVEFRFVKAAWLAWQATGRDDWIRALLPRLERALHHTLTHPWRWDGERGLVKRAYTIDTWDFAYTAGAHDWLQFQIDGRTFWGIMHGDNSGMVEACRLLARLLRRFGEEERARAWEERAGAIAARLNEVCWNGRFYTHFVKLSPVTIAGVDEGEQLSLSNPMAINRGAASHEQAVRILGEYLARRERTAAFAEWFSIDPPFPAGIFGDPKIREGAYCNGGIMPLVGGELARAAFEHGLEAYGVDILRRYHDLVSRSGASHLWYFPDGTPPTRETSTSPEALPSDGWGSSAMLHALVEGLAGIEDLAAGFQQVRLSPRWAAAGVEEAEVGLSYAASGARLGYSYRRADDRLRLEVRAPGAEVRGHVLLPEARRAVAVAVDGRAVPFHATRVGSSPYADFETSVRGRAAVEIRMG